MEKQSVFGTGSSEVVRKAAGHGLATEFLDIEPRLDRIKGYRYLPESSTTARGQSFRNLVGLFVWLLVFANKFY